MDTTGELGVVRHETGHALDDCLGWFSNTEEFKHPYLLDLAQVPAEQSGKLHYFLQKAERGPTETFAELFCYKMGGQIDRGRKEVGELVHRYFPLSEKAMEKRLADLP